jgi:hypothetical protein
MLVYCASRTSLYSTWVSRVARAFQSYSRIATQIDDLCSQRVSYRVIRYFAEIAAEKRAYKSASSVVAHEIVKIPDVANVPYARIPTLHDKNILSTYLRSLQKLLTTDPKVRT